MSDKDNFGAFMIGFFVGALTGAAVSLLLAPQSGEETRSLLKDKAIEIGEKTSDSLEETYQKAQKAANEAQVRANELTQKVKEQTDALQKRGQVVFTEQRSKLSGVIDSARKSAGLKTVAEEPSTPPEVPDLPVE
jgi:gas vesicle protein